MRWSAAFVALWYFLASSVALGSEFGSIYNNQGRWALQRGVKNINRVE